MEHKSYDDYHLEDFIIDATFIDWVLNPMSLHHKFWEVWVAQHPERSKEVEEAREFIRSIHFETHRLPEEVVTHDHRKLKDAIRRTDKAKKQPAGMFHLRNWSRVAAVFAGFLMVAFAFYFIYQYQSPSMIKYATAYGETQIITLPDNSIVTLNANSTLQYAAQWEEREVWLDGEAFFDVKEILLSDQSEDGSASQLSEPSTAEKVKFAVHTEDVKVEVVGTEFNVHNRRGKTEVVLNSGKVKLSAKSLKDTEIEMLPGDYVAFAEDLQKFERKRVNAEDYSAWRQNQLVFRNASFAEIAAILQDNYGIQFVFEYPDFEEFRFTGTTPADSLEVLYTKLTRLFPIKIDQQETQIYIEKQ